MNERCETGKEAGRTISHRRWGAGSPHGLGDARDLTWILRSADGKVRKMLTTIEAEVDDDGAIRPKKPVQLPAGSRVLITVLPPSSEAAETALASEAALAADWEREEEEAAWSHLNRE